MRWTVAWQRGIGRVLPTQQRALTLLFRTDNFACKAAASVALDHEGGTVFFVLVVAHETGTQRDAGQRLALFNSSFDAFADLQTSFGVVRDGYSYVGTVWDHVFRHLQQVVKVTVKCHEKCISRFFVNYHIGHNSNPLCALELYCIVSHHNLNVMEMLVCTYKQTPKGGMRTDNQEPHKRHWK